MTREELAEILADHGEYGLVVEGVLSSGKAYQGRLHYRIDEDQVVVNYEATDELDPDCATFELN